MGKSGAVHVGWISPYSALTRSSLEDIQLESQLVKLVLQACEARNVSCSNI